MKTLFLTVSAVLGISLLTGCTPKTVYAPIVEFYEPPKFSKPAEKPVTPAFAPRRMQIKDENGKALISEYLYVYSQEDARALAVYLQRLESWGEQNFIYADHAYRWSEDFNQTKGDKNATR